MMTRARVPADARVVLASLATAWLMGGSDAIAATITLEHFSDSVCASSSQSTTDVAAGDFSFTTCSGSLAGGGTYFSTQTTRAVFDADLELGAALTLDAFSPIFHEGVTAQAVAWFSDMVTLEGGDNGTTGFLELSFALSGSSFGSGGEFEQAFAFMRFFGTGSPITVGTTGPTTVKVEVPLTFGVETELRMFLSAFAESHIGPSSGTTFTANVDFLSTATLLGVQVLDANKNVLPDGQVTSASNLTYPALSVPEPGTLALLAAGLGAFIVRRRRSARS